MYSADMSKKERRRAIIRRACATALAVLLFAGTGCGGAKQPIVGKWRTGSESNSITWEFLENGAALSGNVRGKYTLGDQNRVKIQTPHATFVYQLEFAGDRMIWVDPKGTRMELTRVQGADATTP